MRRCSGSMLLILLLFSFTVFLFSLPRASGQADSIQIAAGTDEDKALQAITSESDAQKKVAMYQEFVQKFAANPAAVAYGNWQLEQAYAATGDLPKALEYGDKALAGSARNLDILVSVAGAAQQAKNNAKLMDYAAKGGEVCTSIAKQAKPAGMSDEEFTGKVNDESRRRRTPASFLRAPVSTRSAAKLTPRAA